MVVSGRSAAQPLEAEQKEEGKHQGYGHPQAGASL